MNEGAHGAQVHTSLEVRRVPAVSLNRLVLDGSELLVACTTDTARCAPSESAFMVGREIDVVERFPIACARSMLGACARFVPTARSSHPS